jgi:hypothetical protein
VTGLKALLRVGFAGCERSLDRLCGPAGNPLSQLGAIGWLLFWIITISGIYLYIFFDTGVTQAYESIGALTRNQWYAGGIMRSLHRYASDAFVVVVLIHMLREFAFDRLRGRRWFSWLTGLPLLIFIYACGITGYWMVWDILAQYVAITTTQWLDALPIFAKPIAGNFAANARLSGRFFTLMVFLHIALPLVLLLFMWIHIQRHNYAVNPRAVYPDATARVLSLAGRESGRRISTCCRPASVSTGFIWRPALSSNDGEGPISGSSWRQFLSCWPRCPGCRGRKWHQRPS